MDNNAIHIPDIAKKVAQLHKERTEVTEKLKTLLEEGRYKESEIVKFEIRRIKTELNELRGIAEYTRLNLFVQASKRFFTRETYLECWKIVEEQFEIINDSKLNNE